jgi:hypothetical protein
LLIFYVCLQFAGFGPEMVLLEDDKAVAF